MEKASKIGLILILLLMIISPSMEAEAGRKIVIEVPAYKEHLIPDTIDEEGSIQKARCYFNKSEGDRWLKAIWTRESSQAEGWTLVIGDDGRSIGPFQLRISTVQMIAVYYRMDLSYTVIKKDGTEKKVPYSEADIAYKLLFDFDFSVDMAGRYLGHLEKRFQVWSSDNGPNDSDKTCNAL